MTTIDQKERFWLERKGLDFPFYNDDNFGNKEILILTVGVILFIIWSFLSLGDGKVVTFLHSLGYFLFATIPFVIVAKGKMGLIIKRFRLYDFVLIILGTIAMFFLSVSLLLFLMSVGIVSPDTAQANPVIFKEHDFVFAIQFLLQIFGEEMFRLDIFLIILSIVYKKMHKRKLGIVLGILVNAVIFGALHYSVYGNLLQVILVQGSSAVVGDYQYLRTKNIMIPYVSHLLVDIIGIWLSSAAASLLFVL